MFKKKALLPFTIALAILGLMIACGGDEPPKPDPATAKPETAKPAPAPTPREEPRPPEGMPPPLKEAMEERIEVPSDYPEDGLVYPGAHASSSTRRGTRLSVMFSSTDPVEDVISYTEDFLGKQAWEHIDRVDMPNGTLIRADKDGERGVAILISDLEEADAGTLIAVAIDP